MPDTFHPFIPGLEMKWAIEEGQKLKSKIILGGLAIDKLALHALKTEPRMDVLPLIWRYISPRNNKHWQTEIRDTYATLDVHGSPLCVKFRRRDIRGVD